MLRRTYFNSRWLVIENRNWEDGDDGIVEGSEH